MKTPLSNLDIKYNLPMFNGENDVDKFNDWVRKIEVYCRIQKLLGDEVKISLASLRLGRIALVWWERETSKDLLTKGKVISSWYEFVSALKKQLHPLG